MKFKKLIITYLVFLHIAFVFVVFKTDFIPRLEQKFGFPPKEPTQFYDDMLASHLRIDGNLPENTTLFIGDSITQGLATSAITNQSVNYGIGGDTTYGVLHRINQYKSLEQAKTIVLAIGVNDLKRRDNVEILKNYQNILKQISKHKMLVISAILPLDERIKGRVGNTRIREINSALKTLSQQRPNTIFVDVTEQLLDSNHNLATEYHEGDGIHLSRKGYAIWISALIKHIQKD